MKIAFRNDSRIDVTHVFMKESVMVRLEIGLIGFMMVFGIQCASAEKMRLTEKNGVVTITNKASEEARKSRVKKKAPKQASKAAMVRTESRSRNRYMLASEARHRFRMSGDKPSQLIEELGPLSGPRGALHHFKRRLAQTANTGDEKPFTVVHYGDSHSQAGSFANALRQGLTPGPISPGYIHHKFPYSWNARTKKSTGWRRQNWLRNDIPPFGPLGIAFVTQASDETFKVILSDPNRPKGQTRVTLFYDYQPAHRAFHSRWATERSSELVQVTSPAQTLTERHFSSRRRMTPSSPPLKSRYPRRLTRSSCERMTARMTQRGCVFLVS